MLMRLVACLPLVCLIAAADDVDAQNSNPSSNRVSAVEDQSDSEFNHPTRRATPQEIDDAIQTQGYKPVLKEDLQRYLKTLNPDLKHANSNDIVKATYRAILENTDQINGDVQLVFSKARSARRQLGKTNLQNLQFVKDQQKFTLGQASDGNTVLLLPDTLSQIDGYWTRKGRQQSGNTVFDLQLPLSVINEFELITTRDMVVTSSNSLIQNAGPIEDGEFKANRWILYPSENGRLTITCASRVTAIATTDRNFSSSVDYSIRLDDCQARWNLALPGLPQKSEFSLKFSSGLTPQTVVGPGQRALPFSWDSATNELTIKNPTFASLTALIVSGTFPEPTNVHCTLPLLTGGSWEAVDSNSQGELKLSSAVVRASFAPELSVQRSHLTGLMETDVEFAADGSQRLTLEQFRGTASAEFELLIPEPVLQEDVVTRQTGEPGQIETLIKIENRAGVADTLQYDVPRKYRVTAVQELDTQLPLLFRILPVKKASDTQPIEIFFRSPMPRDSRQLIQIQLQSTSNDVNLREANLTNPNYLRLTDSLVTQANQLPPNSRDSDGISYSDFKTAHPWLPAADDNIKDDAIVMERSLFPQNVHTQFESTELTSSIEHSITVDNQLLRESIRIQLTGTPELPREVILRTADTANLTLNPADQQQGWTLQQNASSRSQGEWTLGFPEDQPGTDSAVTLNCERMVTNRMGPMLVYIPSATLHSARITLIAPDENWSLLDDQGQIVTETVAYPKNVFESDFRIQAGNTDNSAKQIHGLATWMLDAGIPDTETPNKEVSSIPATVLVQLSTFGISNQLSLSLDIPNSQRCLCLVNDHQIDVAIRNGQIDILLPDRQSPTQIQILIPGIPIPVHQASTIRIPHVQTNQIAQQSIGTLVVSPTGQQVAATEPASATLLNQGTSKASLQQPQASQSTDIQHFLTRLAFRQSKVRSLLLAPAPSQKFTEVQLVQSNAALIRTVIIAAALILILTFLIPAGAASWIVTGIGILLAQLIGILIPEPAYLAPILTAAFAVSGILTHLFLRRKITTTSQPTAALAPTGSVFKNLFAGLVIVLGIAQTGSGQVVQGQEDILLPDDNSPVVFAPPGLIPKQPAKNIQTLDSMLILNSDVQIQLLDVDSVLATVTCQIAVDPAESQFIELPVQNVTLVDCELNAEPVLPVRSTLETPSIPIAAIPQPGRILSPDIPVIAASAPGWVAGMKVYEIQYTIRIVARPDALGAKASIPLPNAPNTNFSLLDKTNSVTDAELLVPEPVAGVRLGNEFNFPAFSSLSEVQLQLQFSSSAIDSEQPPQSSEIIARVTAVPNALKISCRYELNPVDPRSESVRIARMPNMNLVKVESEAGTSIPPVIDHNFIEIPITVNRQGLQNFQVEWQQDLPLTSDIPIDVKNLRQVNRIPADRLVLVTGTSDRFTCDSVRTEQTSLDAISNNQTPSISSLRTNESEYLIPQSVESVSMQLVRLLDTREASLKQLAVVNTNRIQWTCECELQIPDEPIFRQNLTVSSDVKIQSVSARSEEIDRLQSWYRDKDQLVVCLREATRGPLTITVKGVLPRPPQSDTVLPVVTLPDSVEVLEFMLELSAEKPEDVFIRSLGGTSPNSAFAIETDAVPITPIRFTVTDELRPLTIRASPQKEARANLVALLTEYDNQTQISIFIALQATEAPFNLPLTPPANVAYATSRTFILPAEGSVTESTRSKLTIPVTASGSIDDNDLSVVVFTGIVPALTSDILSLPLPTFGSPCTINSLTVLDSRERNGITELPRWIRNILPDIPESRSPGNANILPANLNVAGDQVSVRLPMTKTKTKKSTTDNLPVYSVTTHQLDGDDLSVQGSTGILAFSPTATSVLKIAMPGDSNLLQVRLDGNISPFAIANDGQISVTLNARICFVELDWMQPVPASTALRSSRLKLPSLIGVTGAILIDPKLPAVHWRLRDKNPVAADFPLLLTEITSGLQMIGTQPISPGPITLEEQDQRISPLTTDPVWAELKSQSADAAEACVRFFSNLSESSDELVLASFNTAEPAIEIRQKVPFSTVLALLAACCMLVAGLTSQSAEKRKTSKAKQPNHVAEDPSAQQLSDVSPDQPKAH